MEVLKVIGITESRDTSGKSESEGKRVWTCRDTEGKLDEIMEGQDLYEKSGQWNNGPIREQHSASCCAVGCVSATELRPGQGFTEERAEAAKQQRATSQAFGAAGDAGKVFTSAQSLI